LRRKVEKTTKIERVLNEPQARVKSYLAALRPYQWLKNTLVFVPLAVADQSFSPNLVLQAALAFGAFSLCASSGYLINDLLDIPSDRHHPHKKERPLASGRLSAAHALALAPVLLLAGIAIGLLLPRPFLVALAAYYGLTVAYSFRLKDVAILDVVTLSVLYTLRLAGGALAVGLPQSSWLLAFCIFLFLSLALVKRYAELDMMRSVDGWRAHARAYVIQDRELIAALGGASGYLAVLVLGLWIGTHDPNDTQYQIVWLDCLLLLYWITRMWLIAHRGRMDDDPLVFALRDNVSRFVILVMAVILIGAQLS
jgi:4-hydroxybenzoate polyprenyltransferase